MGRKRKPKTKNQRIRIEDWLKIKRRASKKQMSIPDYISWRLSR